MTFKTVDDLLASPQHLNLEFSALGQRELGCAFLFVLEGRFAREAVLGHAVHAAGDVAADFLTLRDELAVAHLGARADREAVGFLLADAQLAVLFVGQQFATLEWATVFDRALGVGDDVLTEVQHLLELPGAQVQQCADLAGDVLDVPDVRGWRGQLDVTHAVTPHDALGDFDAAALANLALVALTLVLAAGALVIFFRPEDPLVKETVALWFQRAVIDRLGLLDLAVTPRANFFGAGELNLDFFEIAH